MTLSLIVIDHDHLSPTFPASVRFHTQPNEQDETYAQPKESEPIRIERAMVSIRHSEFGEGMDALWRAASRDIEPLVHSWDTVPCADRDGFPIPVRRIDRAIPDERSW